MPGVRDAYDGSAASWRRGPEAVYARLAEALLSVTPVDLTGAKVVDVGAGTGVAARAALAGGAASAVATDVAAQMLRGRPARVAAVLADGARLPFADHSFDLATAAFCLGHMPDPAEVVSEIHRVSPALLASAFVPGPPHPAKTAIDAVFARAGFVLPAWYRHQKDVLEPRVDDPAALERLARDAGFGAVEVRELEVDTGLSSPADVVRWRVGMAHLAPFVAGLDQAVRERVSAEAEEAVADLMPVVIPMLALSAS